MGWVGWRLVDESKFAAGAVDGLIGDLGFFVAVQGVDADAGSVVAIAGTSRGIGEDGLQFVFSGSDGGGGFLELGLSCVEGADEVVDGGFLVGLGGHWVAWCVLCCEDFRTNDKPNLLRGLDWTLYPPLVGKGSRPRVVMETPIRPPWLALGGVLTAEA